MESPEGLLVNRLAAKAASAPVDVLRDAVHLAGRFAGDPVGTTTGAVRFAMSLRRVLTPADAPHSPALSGGGSGYRLETLDIPLRPTQGRGRAAGGSVNDAFLAALLGGIRRYHEKFSLEVDVLPMAIPVSLRTDADPMGANKFAAARFVAPVGEADPAARIDIIHRFISEARTEPALGFLDLIAPVLSRLPTIVLTRLAGGMTVPRTCRRRISAASGGRCIWPEHGSRIYPMGPRPGHCDDDDDGDLRRHVLCRSQLRPRMHRGSDRVRGLSTRRLRRGDRSRASRHPMTVAHSSSSSREAES